MQGPHPLIYQEESSPADDDVLLQGVIQGAEDANGMSRIRSFAFFVKDAAGQVIAGAKGVSLYGSLYVDLLWVSQTLRNQGLGTKIMQACEKLAHERNCTFIALTTMNWEALPFYQKLGYEIEYVREGYEKNSKMYLLRKNL